MKIQEKKTYITSETLSVNEQKFLAIIRNPALRANLVALLQETGLLSAFLEVENETA